MLFLVGEGDFNRKWLGQFERRDEPAAEVMSHLSSHSSVCPGLGRLCEVEYPSLDPSIVGW